MQHPLQLVWPASVDPKVDVAACTSSPAPAAAGNLFDVAPQVGLVVLGEVAVMVVQAIIFTAADGVDSSPAESIGATGGVAPIVDALGSRLHGVPSHHMKVILRK